MEKTTITVVVQLTIASDKKLTENDREQLVAEMEYNFCFAEIMNEKYVSIIDTEITEMLESD